MTPLDPPAPNIIQRATAIRKAMKEVAKLYATRQINGALRERNGPQVQRFEIGSNVLVWSVHKKKWTGPFKLLAISGETCTVALPNGPTQFRSTVIRVAAGQGQGPRVRAEMSLEGPVRAQMFGPQVRAGPNFEARP